MTDDELVEGLIQNGCFAADNVAIESRRSGDSGAQTTRKIIARALEALEANGMIEFVPSDQWPRYFVPEPPYMPWWEQ